jgi:3-dehydroquinate dehydratase-2
MRVLVINGPNLDLLGRREPEIYGSGSLGELISGLESLGLRHGVQIESVQSNDEGEIIRLIHETSAEGILINPGAFGHTSYAIADALRAVGIPTVEVHISNIRDREGWRAHTVTGEACVLTIYGRGRAGYSDGLRHLVNRAAHEFETIGYGPHQANRGDLRRGLRDGLVLLVHGGVWRHQYGRDTMESLAVDLTRKGHHTWNIGYRVLGTDGGWPGSGHDVLTAIQHATHLDLGPIRAVVGHSAGGYLSMWAAARESSRVGRVVVLAPVVDLTDAVVSAGALSRESAILLQTGAPALVNPGGVPAMAVHGTKDDIVPIRHTRLLDGHAEVLETDGGHFDLLDPSKPHWEWVVERLA